MFTPIFNAASGTVEAKDVITCLIAGIVLGLLISLIYIFSDKEKKYSAPFAFSLAILPVIVTAVIMLVGSDIAKAISLGGVFALVRFRSVPGNSKDITSVFLAMSIGLACGMGYVNMAATLAVLIGVYYFVLSRFQYGVKRAVTKQLRITIPENLDYEGVFDDLFKEYTKKYELERVRTTNLGTLYELTYIVDMKPNVSQKQFIDSIRCRNGNLNIVLGKLPDKIEQL